MPSKLAKSFAIALLAGTAAGVSASEIDECGHAQSYAGCGQFFPLAAPYRQYGIVGSSPVAGSILHLKGEIVPCSDPCGTYSPDSCLVVAEVNQCVPQDLGCGIRRGNPDPITTCCFWDSFQYGRVELFGSYCQFEDGDTVHVVGLLDYNFSSPICLFSPPSLREGFLTLCPDSATQAAARSWGRVKAYYR